MPRVFCCFIVLGLQVVVTRMLYVGCNGVGWGRIEEGHRLRVWVPRSETQNPKNRDKNQDYLI